MCRPSAAGGDNVALRAAWRRDCDLPRGTEQPGRRAVRRSVAAGALFERSRRFPLAAAEPSGVAAELAAPHYHGWSARRRAGWRGVALAGAASRPRLNTAANGCGPSLYQSGIHIASREASAALAAAEKNVTSEVIGLWNKLDRDSLSCDLCVPTSPAAAAGLAVMRRDSGAGRRAGGQSGLGPGTCKHNPNASITIRPIKPVIRYFYLGGPVV